MGHRRISLAVATVLSLVISGMTAATFADKAAAQAEPPPPVGLLTEGVDPGSFVGDGGQLSMDQIGKAIGGTNSDDDDDHYWVADSRDDGDAAVSQLLSYPGTLDTHDRESMLSGDGTTFVATYAAEGVGLGTCSYDSGNPDGGALYWRQQILIWERDDFDPVNEEPTSFGAPALVSRQDPFDPLECTFDPDGGGPQPSLMGVGGDQRSWSPTVTRDGDEVAFVSEARNLGAAPTDPNVAGLFLWSGPTGVEMVTPANMNGDVTEAMVSGDGNRIVFVSRATNLPVPETIPCCRTQVFVATRGGGGSWSFELASRSTAGAVATDGGQETYHFGATIDRAGERVAFLTGGDNLESGVSGPSLSTSPTLVVRDLDLGVTRVARTRHTAVAQAHNMGSRTGAPRLSEDGESLAIYGSNYFPNEARIDTEGHVEEDQLLVFDVDQILSSDAEERRTARRSRRVYDVPANASQDIAFAGAGDDNLVAFPSDAAPLPRYRGSGLHLFMAFGGAIGSDESRGWHGDPVDVASGAFRHDEIDLVAPAGAGPVELDRTYSSVGETAGVFGPGWSSNLDTRFEIDLDGDLFTIVRSNGERIVFDGSSGTLVPLGGHRLTLDWDDGWFVTDPSGRTWSFDSVGRLAGWSVPGQPAVTVTWGDRANATVSSDTGFALELVDWSYGEEWDPVAGAWVPVVDPEPDGTVDQATTSDGRRVGYTYTVDAHGADRLTTVSRPHAVGQDPEDVGRRTYEMDGNLLTRIVDQVDATRTKVVVENTYDARGRVVHQVTATGDGSTFVYGEKPDPFGVLVDAPGFTTVTDEASGDVTVYEHNGQGEVVGITDATGNSLTRSWATDRPVAATSRSGVTTDHVYDDAGRLVEVTQTAGATTRTVASYTYVTPDSSPAALTDDRIATSTDEAGVTTTFTYDGAAREPETVSVPCDPASTATPCPGSGLATTTYTYFSGSLAGLVESVTDADGVVTEYTYAADRSVESVTTHDGVTPLVTTYGTVRVGDPGWSEANPAAVEVRTTESPGGAVTTEVVDAGGRVIEVRDPLFDGVTHLATTFTYGFDGELVSMTDPAGGVTTYAVARPGDPGWAEASGIAEVRTVTGPDGISSITKTDRSGDVVVEQRGDPGVPSELATTTHVYGELGRLASTTDPMGVTTSYVYDVEGRVTEVVDEDGERTLTAHDDFGRPVVVTDPLGETTTTTYGADGRVASVEDGEGHDTTYTYDDAGRPLTTTDARGGVVERRYTLAGRLASETDATGRTTDYRHDTAGRQVEVELPSGATTTTAYDLDGRIASVTSPEGRVTSYTYDELGRVETVADPGSGTTTTTYTPTGEVATRTDATGGEVAFTYDGGGRVVTVSDPLGEVTTYGYDSRGNRTMRTDALAGEREWRWNLADQLIEEIDPLDRSTTYTYDTLGRLDMKTDGAGRTETYGYDAAGQVTSLTYASGTPTTFEYDGEGRRTKMIDATGTTLWHYNATGLMTGADLPGSRDLAFAWDLAGRRTVIDYPDGSRYRNRYDTNGRLAEVEFDDSGTWVDVAVNDYDADGLLIEQDQGSAGLREWTYDAVTGRLTGYDETRGLTTTSTTLTHDAAGRILTETTGGISTVYDYDDAGQLTDVDRSTGVDETYAYDELGRRSTAVVGATTTTYQWDAASQLTRRVVNGANHNYQYDTSGRRTREAWNGGANVLQWFWGARGTMTGQRSTEPGTVTDTARATRGDGTLAALTTTVNSVVTDTTSIVWDPTLPVPQPVWTGDPGTANAARAVYGPDLIEFTCPTGTSCTGPAHHDAYGSALRTTATSAITLDTTYTPWGDGGGTFTTGADHGYRSELHTGATIHLRARDYDPDTGLFLTPDPLDGIDGTTTVNNPYHYTNNDPLNSVDPLGLRPDDADLGCGPGEQPSQGTGATNDVYVAGDEAYPTYCSEIDTGGWCFTWQDGCTSFISQWTGGSFCSALFDNECTAIKESHPGLYRALLVIAGGAIVVAACAMACPAAASIAIPTGGLAALSGVTAPAGIMVITVSQGALAGAAGTLAGLGVHMASGGSDAGAPFGNGGTRPPRANSYRNTDAGAHPNRQAAWDHATRDRRNYRYASTRAECSSTACHVHLDIYNNRGQLLETRHYSYPKP